MVNPAFASVQRNEALRFEVVEQLDDAREASLRTFFRQIGLAHVFSELIVPALRGGRAFVNLALGVQRVNAAILVHAIGREDASLTTVFVADDQLTNVGLTTALFEDTLRVLRSRGKSLVTYVVSERSGLADRILTNAGFVRGDQSFLTESLRYYVYSGEIGRVLGRLGLAEVFQSDILAERLEDGVFERNALFQATTQLASRAYWNESSPFAELIANTGLAEEAVGPADIATAGSASEIERGKSFIAEGARLIR